MQQKISTLKKKMQFWLLFFYTWYAVLNIYVLPMKISKQGKKSVFSYLGLRLPVNVLLCIFDEIINCCQTKVSIPYWHNFSQYATLSWKQLRYIMVCFVDVILSSWQLCKFHYNHCVHKSIKTNYRVYQLYIKLSL